MKKLVIALCALLTVVTAHGENLDQDTEQRIRNSLAILLPNLRPDSIRATPIENLYEVAFGLRLVYMTADGRFLLQGKIIDLETRTEVTDDRLAELKSAAMATVDDSQVISFGPDNAAYTVSVFTDIDCGFCRKMHSEMAAYNENGIRIRYLFYPRAGIGSGSYDKAVSVWCADDRKAAMDVAKAGGTPPAKTCANPVAEHHALGQQMTIQGTPAIVLQDGDVLPGYLPPAKLRQLLDKRASGG